jgi:hypothetical protein
MCVIKAHVCDVISVLAEFMVEASISNRMPSRRPRSYRCHHEFLAQPAQENTRPSCTTNVCKTCCHNTTPTNHYFSTLPRKTRTVQIKRCPGGRHSKVLRFHHGFCVLGLGSSGCDCCTVPVFRHTFTIEVPTPPRLG